MDNKIQELTQKIYSEGVEKGKEQAALIIENAKKQEQEILRQAQEQSDKILADALKQKETMERNARSELQLFAGQALEALKSQITNLITDTIVKQAVDKATDDKVFMQQMILSLVREWGKNETITIQTDQAEQLKAFFAANAKELLDKGLTIEQVNGIKAGFTLLPKNGSYKITFGNEQFLDYFKKYLRPQLFDMLFVKEK